MPTLRFGPQPAALASPALQDGCPAQLKAVTLTKDHLAIYPGERARIERSGGYVSKEGRLSGRIQVSRAFGDAPFKKVVNRLGNLFKFNTAQGWWRHPV